MIPWPPLDFLGIEIKQQIKVPFARTIWDQSVCLEFWRDLFRRELKIFKIKSIRNIYESNKKSKWNKKGGTIVDQKKKKKKYNINLLPIKIALSHICSIFLKKNIDWDIWFKYVIVDHSA